MQQAENAQFYVKKKSYARKKLGKIKRDIKVVAHRLCGITSGDYSAKRINAVWEGKPTRYDLINQLIETNSYKSYLEVGCSKDDCFRAISVPNKIGVDPFHGGTHRMTSDAFFAENTQKFDIIFIDGLHQYAQVRLDMLNAVESLNDGGVILVHDCLPLTFKAQLPFPPGGDWNGDVWKAFAEMRTLPNIDCALSMIDHGVGIIKKRGNTNRLDIGTKDFLGLKYADLVNHYERWLNCLSYEETLKFVENK